MRIHGNKKILHERSQNVIDKQAFKLEVNNTLNQNNKYQADETDQFDSNNNSKYNLPSLSARGSNYSQYNKYSRALSSPDSQISAQKQVSSKWNKYTHAMTQSKPTDKDIYKDKIDQIRDIENNIDSEEVKLGNSQGIGQGLGLIGSEVKTFRSEKSARDIIKMDARKTRSTTSESPGVSRGGFNSLKLPLLDRNKPIFTIDEKNQGEENDEEPEKKRFVPKIKKRKVMEDPVDKVREQQETKREEKGFKLRFHIENMNGFWQLFRTVIKLSPSDWVELQHPDYLICNQIHLQKNKFPHSTKQCPKNQDDKLEFYKNKQKEIIQFIENNPTQYQMKKMEKQINQEITNETQFRNQYTIFSHLENNEEICTKEGLNKNLIEQQKANGLDLKDCLLPLTFHINHRKIDENEWEQFKEYFESCKQKVWIVKPGVESNKGYGIKVFNTLDEIWKYTQTTDQPKWVVQKQIEKPLLIRNRKFDIRIFALITSLHGNMKAQFFKYAYIRTNSLEYSLTNLSDPLVHLSNDAIQVKDKENQGKFEDHNKMSVAEFTRDQLYPKTKNQNQFQDTLWPKMRDEFKRLVHQVKNKMDPDRRHHGFEILGLDFMLDNSLKLYFIEVNNNPALGTFGCKVLENAIFAMRTDAFNLSVNKLFYAYQDSEKVNKNQELIQDDSKDL